MPNFTTDARGIQTLASTPTGEAGIALQSNFTTISTLIGTLQTTAAYPFTQPTPAAVWHVTHPLNRFPAVTVVDSANSVVIGDVTYIDQSNLTITFSGQFSGTAYLT